MRWLHFSILMLRKKSIFRFPKVMKFRRSSRKEFLVFVCWNDFLLSSKLGDSATLHRLNYTRCNYDAGLYVRKEKVTLRSSLFLFMILSLHVFHKMFFPKSKLLSQRVTKWVTMFHCLVALGFRLQNVKTVYNWLQGLNFSRCLRNWQTRLQTLQDSCSCSFQ